MDLSKDDKERIKKRVNREAQEQLCKDLEGLDEEIEELEDDEDKIVTVRAKFLYAKALKRKLEKDYHYFIEEESKREFPPKWVTENAQILAALKPHKPDIHLLTYIYDHTKRGIDPRYHNQQIKKARHAEIELYHKTFYKNEHEKISNKREKLMDNLIEDGNLNNKTIDEFIRENKHKYPDLIYPVPVDIQYYASKAAVGFTVFVTDSQFYDNLTSWLRKEFKFNYQKRYLQRRIAVFSKVGIIMKLGTIGRNGTLYADGYILPIEGAYKKVSFVKKSPFIVDALLSLKNKCKRLINRTG